MLKSAYKHWLPRFNYTLTPSVLPLPLLFLSVIFFFYELFFIIVAAVVGLLLKRLHIHAIMDVAYTPFATYCSFSTQKPLHIALPIAEDIVILKRKTLVNLFAMYTQERVFHFNIIFNSHPSLIFKLGLKKERRMKHEWFIKVQPRSSSLY